MKNKIIWSSYQKKIFLDINKGTGNTLVIARAGSAKTSSLVEGSKFIPKGKKALFCAFNKSIQEELRSKLGSYVDCFTLHSLGFRAIKNKFGNVELDQYKCWNLVEEFFSHPKENFDLIDNICKTVDFCKATLTDVPSKIEQLMIDYDIDACGEEIKTFISYVCKALRQCKEMTNKIDFTDMIWFPFVYKLNPGKFDYVFVDECFPYKQCIATENGKIQIGSIFNKFSKNLPLPLIRSYNELEGKFELCKITNAWDRGVKKIIEIQAGKRKIRCTENHKFLTDNGWVEAGQLLPGSLIKTSTPNVSNNQIEGHIQHSLNDDQLQIVLGSFLGDGSIKTISNHSYRLEINHGIDQENYCAWKASMFCCEIKRIEKNGYAQTPAIGFKTKSFSIPNSFFPKNKNHCPQWVLDKLDARGLAIWFMDDGNKSTNHESGRFSTCSFDEDSQQRIVKKLKDFGIESRCVFYKTKNQKEEGYYYITLNKDPYLKLCDIIKPYTHNNIDYKISKPANNKYIWNNNYNPYGFCAVDKIIDLNSYEKVYDIEVEKNHNFIVCSGLTSKSNTGLIAHNCQDLNVCQVELALSAVKPGGRVIAVMDNRQAIYSWRGADAQMIDKIRERLNPKELLLPICYRCPKKVVELAQTIVPDIQVFDQASEGTINYIDISELAKQTKPGSYVISRTNAPLIKHCLKFLKAGIPSNILGRDVGDGLAYLLKRSKKKRVDAFLSWLQDWAKQEKIRILAKYPKASTEVIDDKVECMENLCEGAKTLEEVKHNIDMLFKENDERKIVLFSSIHRIKGKESDHVFVLTNTLRSSSEEELNLKYVAFTRSKNALYMVQEKTKYDTWEDAKKK